MPLLRRQPFTKEKPPSNLTAEDEVFYCELTNEVFTDYEKFFGRIILCNSLVWTCATTGRSGLTYQEALDSEEKAKKQISSFPEALRKPVLYLASLTHRSRLNDLNDDVYMFCKERYFVNEVVEVDQEDDRMSCRIVKVIAPGSKTANGDTDSDVICLDDDSEDEEKNDGEAPNAEEIKYMVQHIKKPNIYMVPPDCISRKKGVFAREKCKLFLKQHCDPDKNGIWRVKERYVKKMNFADMRWNDFFDGTEPHFEVSHAKKKPKASPKGKGKPSKKGVIDLTDEDSKIKKAKKLAKEVKKKKKEEKGTAMNALVKNPKQMNIDQEKQAVKEIEKQIEKVRRKQDRLQRKYEKRKAKQKQKRAEKLGITVEELEKLEQLKKQQEEAKVKKLTPEERAALQEKFRLEREKIKEEKRLEKEALREELKKKREEEQLKKKEEREKEREKKKEEKRIQDEYLKEWSKPREDLECDDLKDLPVPTPVRSRVPSDLFGDAVMVLEYFNCFNSIFEFTEEFPEGITLDDLGRALQSCQINGLYVDIVRFLLVCLFHLQTEEDEDIQGDEDNAAPNKVEEENVSLKELVKQATAAAQWPMQNFSTPLNKLPLDSFTITEILRLHFLSSGAKVSEECARYRFLQRGGFTAQDDAGLEFRRQEAHIIKELGERNLYDLPPGAKLKVLNALIQQLLTYVSCRDNIEDNMENWKSLKNQLRQHQWAQNKREHDEKSFWFRKRQEDRQKEKELQMKIREEKQKAREEQLRQDELKKQGGDNQEEKKDTRLEKKNKSSPEAKAEPERRSARAAAKETKAQEPEIPPERVSTRFKERDIDALMEEENIEWDKVSPEDKILMKEKYEQQELDIIKDILSAQHGTAIYPLGRDRTMRRYWRFSCIPGLFVEDVELHCDDDFYEVAEQKDKTEDVKKEEIKCNASDKENDSFDGTAVNNAINVDGDVEMKDVQETKDNVLQTVAENKTVTENIIAIPETKVIEENTLPCESVFQQIKNRNTIPWAYYNTPEQLNALIDGLNPRGYREGPLKQNLIEIKRVLVSDIPRCPTNILHISEEDADKMTQAAQASSLLVKSRRKKVGTVMGDAAKETLELNLREMLLDLEERIYVGSLGSLKVIDRMKWRDGIEGGSYDAQCNLLEWGGEHTLSVQPKIVKMNGDSKPGDDSDDDDDVDTVVVQDLSKALLQLEQMIEPKYLNPPLGDNEKTRKEKQLKALELAMQGLTPRKIKAKVWAKKKKTDENGEDENEENKDSSDEEEESTVERKSSLERWEESLMNATSIPQLFLYLSVLDNSITWAKSALNARCKICRRKGDDEKMLLCDGCDFGYHMYCLKPPMKRIPKDNWFCANCKPKVAVKTPRKQRRKSFVEEQAEESEEEEESSDEAESGSSSDEEASGSEEEGSDDEEGEEDSDDSGDSSSEEEDESEEEEKPAKIQLGRFKGKKGDTGGKSSKSSSRRSSRSNTPKRDSIGKGKKRESLEKTVLEKAARAAAKKTSKSRHSIETEMPTKKSKGGRAGSRNSLGGGGPSKRGRTSDVADDAPPAKKPLYTSKSRAGGQVEATKSAEALVGELAKKPESWPFLSPVSKRDAPDYFDIIKKPMDFATLKANINKFTYKSPGEIIADIRLIFSNCAAYNMPTAPEFAAGQKLSKFCEKRLKELHLVQYANGEASTSKNSPKKSSPGTSRSSKRT